MMIKKTLWLLAILLIFATIAGVWYFRRYANSANRSLSAFENLSTLKSVHLFIELPKLPEKPYLTAEGSINLENEEFSKYRVSIDAQNEAGDVSELTFVTNNNESFVKPKFSNVELLEKRVSAVYPQYKKLSITSTVKDLLEKDLWLKLSSPKQEDTQNILTEEQSKILWSKLKKSIIVRSIKDINQDQTELKLGFNQRKLIDAIEYLRSTNSILTLKEVNAIKNFVQSSQGWNKDLVIVKIDKNTSQISELSIYLPDDPSLLIKQIGFSDPMRFGSSVGPLFTVIPTKIFDVFSQENKEDLVYIANIKFSDFNSIEEITKPANVMEYSDFAQLAQKEVYPIMKDYFKDSTPSSTINKP